MPTFNDKLYIKYIGNSICKLLYCICNSVIYIEDAMNLIQLLTLIDMPYQNPLGWTKA